MKKNKIGKKAGTALYFHKEYLCSMPEEIIKDVRSCISSYIRGGTIFKKIDIIRMDKEIINFIEVDSFDKKINPSIKYTYTFKKYRGYWRFTDKKIGCIVNPTIIHKKELMVGEDYKGFSYSLAEEWSKIIESSQINSLKDSRKILKQKYWSDCMKKLELAQFELINNFKYNWNKQFA